MKSKFIAIFTMIFFVQTGLHSQEAEKYIRLPFILDDNNHIQLQFNVENDLNFLFDFDISGDANKIYEETGISKILNAGGYKEKFEDIILANTVFGDESGKVKNQIHYLFENDKLQLPLSELLCNNNKFDTVKFFAIPAKGDVKRSDGIISPSFFGKVTNIIINYKTRIIEINASNFQGKSIPLYKLEFPNIFYIYGEINGKKAPFFFSTQHYSVYLRNSDKKTVEFSEDDILRTFYGSYKDFAYFNKEQNSNIKISNFSKTYKAETYTTDNFFGNDAIDKLSPLFNILGNSFFENKCIGFDFKHSKFYIWE